MHQISKKWLSIEDLGKLLANKEKLSLSEESQTAIQTCYDFLHQKINATEQSYYGINTGFGSLCNIKIEEKELETLQSNLVRSHACGIGDLVPEEVIQIILLLKIKSLSLGHSAVSLPLVERLVEMYNETMWPVLYQLGSLGASGDLAPLAHLSLPLIGEGEVFHNGVRKSSESVLKEQSWQPIQLQAKEGLALLNGTQFSTGYGVWALLKAQRLSKLADLIAAISMDAFACVTSPFDERLHQVRAHEGQLQTAANIRKLLEGSVLAASPKETVQDPYAFRCVPQVHGASKDTIAHAQKVIEREINSVTDNPNIFPDSDAILSGGNFHAQPIALVLDFLAIALSELGSISERRLYQLIGGQRGLPAFLTPKSGLHSGLMITQYTAASIASQNKQLCMPASVDSIVSCNGQEDHVSMAANAGTKLYKVVQNVERLLAIELLSGIQALSFRTEKSSPIIEEIVEQFRAIVPVMESDHVFSEDMAKALSFVQKIDINKYL
ncbi:histidine ammonia-lyase [Aureispira sp. CCB-E]|uniref:histidine ammonia-lyase n=1 Tax=Aureispira sp. CCB-E TaxID=3051121 RepID=UPI002868A71B|nr:histidine ammonia-lyase [Aureispira sp. CCB-E]WMX13744.1 histidine ammonia-lyase [Aureispira sp. CCB-E]